MTQESVEQLRHAIDVKDQLIAHLKSIIAAQEEQIERLKGYGRPLTRADLPYADFRYDPPHPSTQEWL